MIRQGIRRAAAQVARPEEEMTLRELVQSHRAQARRIRELEEEVARLRRARDEEPPDLTDLLALEALEHAE